jgi:putative transposase
MNTIFKSFKFRIYPTKEQEIVLAKHFGACRFVFNHYLNKRKETYLKDKKSLNYYDNANDLTQLKKNIDYSWLKEINSQSLQSSLKNLDTAYSNFFRKNANFPKFKSKYDRQSFNIPQFVKLKDNKLIIPKFKGGVKINLHREITGDIIFANISKSATDKYYVSITCEVVHKPFEKTNSAVGIDTGIKNLAILSDGKTYENIRSLKTKLTKLKYEQRQLSKKVKGSSSRNKQRKNLAKIHEKITNVRKDYLHKVSTEIVKNHDIISVEDFAVKNLMKNNKLSQSISDVSLGTFYSMLEYKSRWNNKQFVKINRFFPSSKVCSNCNWINHDLTLSIREWSCPSCGETHDRDFNASKNILNQGLKILSGLGTKSDIKQKQAESFSLEEAMKPETH